MSDAHRCLTDKACRRAETIDEERVGAATEDANTLCPACRTHIESAIHQLPRDWQELRAALGERASAVGLKIRSTPTPPVPISTRKDALMVAIVDMAERAAFIVAAGLHSEFGDRRPPADAEPGSLVERLFDDTHTHDRDVLAAAVAMVEPNIDLLAQAPAETYAVWDKAGEDNQERIVRDEEGEAIRARGRVFVDLTGMDIALQLVELHNQCRAELGLTRLRHRYPMPCPRCGSRVGRDDGQTIVTCDDRTTCKASWTEREYQFLAGLITRERLDMEILKYLLAEAYSRLDVLSEAADIIRDNAFLDTDPSGGRVMLEVIDGALAGHLNPEQRAITTDRKATEQRQTTEDTWAFQNEQPYRPPKRKPQKAARPVDSPIAASSLTTLVDIDENAVINGDARCRDCNLVHAGDCA